MQTKPSASLSHYGTLEDRTPVNIATLKNSHGIEMDVISYGGIITRLITPDAKGKFGNIVLGQDSLEDYVAKNPYFGAIIGRYGNRIADGKFEIQGVAYQLARNDGDNHLHGGLQGFDKKVWQMATFVTENSAGVELNLVSPDGDQGYPGTLATKVVYELTNSNTLDMRFSATSDKPTIVNMTQHSYFNLAGEGSILNHTLQVNADNYTPIDNALIPTGEISPVQGTPFDFLQPKAIGENISDKNQQLEFGLGYDHNFILNVETPGELIEAAKVIDPKSGRSLRVFTVEPAIQFYSGNFLDGTLKQHGRVHKYRTGLCLEPQHSPDSPNKPHFPSTLLMPGEQYHTRIVYAFGNEK